MKASLVIRFFQKRGRLEVKMQNSKVVKRQLKDVSALNDLVSSLEELSAMRYRKTKGSVLTTRGYLDEINFIYRQVKNNYKQLVEKSLTAENNVFKKPKATETAFRTTSKGTIYVLLSANGGLFGDVISRNFANFKNYISRIPADEVAVVGTIGQRLFEFSELKEKYDYHYFPLSDSSADSDNLDKLLKYCLDFKTIVIFYTRFVEILNQKPVADSVTGDIVFEEAISSFSAEQPNFERDFLFEPDIEKVLGLFESQMINTLFEQKILESGLSKFTSRMVELDNASQRIKQNLKKYSLDYQRIKHIESNRKASVQISGAMTLL
jgi:ATP synthase F1 gamma subunit